jgi:delta8-fatty-acid desaturase
MSTTKLWTRGQVASSILAGDCLVVFDAQILRIPTSWLEAHPGGPLAILHFVGRDATDEILAYHCNDTLRKLKGYIIGRVECGNDGWEPFLPPVMSGWVRKSGNDGALEWFHQAGSICYRGEPTEHCPSQILLVQKDNPLLQTREHIPTMKTITPPSTTLSLNIQTQHSAAYKALHKQIVDRGLYKTPYLTGYSLEIARYVFLGGASIVAYRKNWLMASAFFLGLLWHQLAFTAHDLGHMGVTHNWVVDRILGTIIADFMGGLSIGWWVEVCVAVIIQLKSSGFSFAEPQCPSL